MVAQRRVGKSITFTPVSEGLVAYYLKTKHAEFVVAQEQFTDNWNHLTNAPVVEGEETAGNYDWWTNLYGIGLVCALNYVLSSALDMS